MKLILVTTFLTAFHLISGCSKSKLASLKEMSVDRDVTYEANVNFCTLEAGKIKTNLKFVFVIDKSGSNQQRKIDNVAGLPGTDEEGIRRYDPIVDFLNNKEQDEHVFYSIVNFSSSANTQQNFTNDKDQFLAAVLEERDGPCKDSLIAPFDHCPADAGWTNYIQALDNVKSLINNDIAAAKLGDEVISSYYVVFFISDGEPIVDQQLQAANDIEDQVHGLTALSKAEKEWVDSVQIHTGYYFSGYDGNPVGDSETARNGLAIMAEKGAGDAYEFSGGQQIDFSKFGVPERNIEHSLKDILVLNLSTIWSDGYQYADSDADGISDVQETSLGSNPNNRDSDGNGVSDLVEYRVQGKPCGSVTCLNSGALSFAPLCDAASFTNDQDGDLLNDCEELLLGSKRDNFDSNGDWIPDDIALRYAITIKDTSNDEAQNDLDWDNVTNYNEIKFNTPINFNNANIFALKSQIYDLKTLSVSSKESCFHLNIPNIKVLNDTGLIRSYILEGTSAINDKKFLRIAEKTLGQGNGLNFVDADFKTAN